MVSNDLVDNFIPKNNMASLEENDGFGGKWEGT